MRKVFEQAVEVFGELCDLPEADRARRLAALQAGDPELAAAVAELLQGDQRPDGRIDRQAKDFVALESVAFERGAETVPAGVIERLVERGRASTHYRVEGKLAEGGMGTIHAIWDEDIERRLVLKTLGKRDEHHESLGRRRLRRFLDEARVTGQLDHPGIVPVHDLGIDARGRAYFTMKYVKGSTLQDVFDLVRAGLEGWTQTRAVGVLLRVCEAMAYAHSKGVVHRDLKPSNVMVGRFGEVYVMDWGVAWVLSAPDARDLRPREQGKVLAPTGEMRVDSPVVTMDGTVVGTPYYMSPEQARGGSIDERSDVYAIGAMLYTLLTGQPPHRESTGDTHAYEVLKRVIEGPPLPIRRLARAPAELEAVCEKAMARAAEERYGTVQELGEDLRAYLEGRVVHAHETGAVAELRKWVLRNRAFASATATALGILIGGLFIVWGLRQEAEASEREALAERASAARLMNLHRLRYSIEEAEELWPAHPERVPAYLDWLVRAQTIPEALLAERRRLLDLRDQALPLSDGERERDRRAHPRYAEFRRLEARLAAERRAQAVRDGELEPEEFVLDERTQGQDPNYLNERAWMFVRPDRTVFGREAEALALAQVAGLKADGERLQAAVSDTLAWAYLANGLDDEARSELGASVEAAQALGRDGLAGQVADLEVAIEEAASGKTLAQLESEFAALEQEVSQRCTWRFAQEEDRVWHDVLAETETMLLDAATLVDGTSSQHGWGVERRLEWARRVEALTLTDDGAARRWRAAIASIADPATSPAYGGMVIEPQLGLLPLGRDVHSGLWEFALLQSGEAPERDGAGRLVLTEDSGIVLVLLPGGTFPMGNQGARPGWPNHDPLARPSEGPVHEVKLSPFFLSKHEMTQAQWLRMTGENPSFYSSRYEPVKGTTDLHPVESVSWFDCERVCRWLGLRLPTEAEWEYAARAGTRTPWWSGAQRDTLVGRVNLADQAASRAGAPFTEIRDWPELDDGFPVHAPVDALSANPFGLHHVHGNVFEWCRDVFEADFYARSPDLDPVNEGAGQRVSRGGSFRGTSAVARAAYRQSDDPGTAQSSLGLRPARALSGSW